MLVLPDALMTLRDGGCKRDFRRPSVAEVVAVDPSEAICSSRLLPLLPEYFTAVRVRPYGGAILHMLLAGVAQARGGLPARSAPCEPFAPHGFYGVEAQTVDAIVRWMNGEALPAEVR